MPRPAQQYSALRGTPPHPFFQGGENRRACDATTVFLLLEMRCGTHPLGRFSPLWICIRSRLFFFPWCTVVTLVTPWCHLFFKKVSPPWSRINKGFTAYWWHWWHLFWSLYIIFFVFFKKTYLLRFFIKKCFQTHFLVTPVSPPPLKLGVARLESGDTFFRRGVTTVSPPAFWCHQKIFFAFSLTFHVCVILYNHRQKRGYMSPKYYHWNLGTYNLKCGTI